MNTARSVWLGWTTLMVAGAGAYYFAKKDINAYRREQELKGIRGTEYLECTFLSLPRLFPMCSLGSCHWLSVLFYFADAEKRVASH